MNAGEIVAVETWSDFVGVLVDRASVLRAQPGFIARNTRDAAE
jgi:hypothetical protein